MLRGVVLLLLSQLLLACVSRAPVEPPRRAAASQVVVTANDPEPVKTTDPTLSVEGPKKACANCPTPDPDFAPQLSEVPGDVADVPDAVPVDEPRSRYGNPETYDALGAQYRVLKKTPPGYREHGRASWYGKKFHGRRTANGEIYDMFKMTAAHKTLPLPSYVRVTSKANGRSVVVRVNDRGPFHPGRIIDLSYAAAVRLDLLKHGSAEVEMEVLTPQQGKRAVRDVATRTEGKPRYLEVGRFADPIDAISLRDKLARLGYGDTEFLQVTSPSGDGTENILRIGPFKNFSRLDEARIKLGRQDITAIPVAD
ncbi:MAG: septal ring lytic transglycosylase RlpA family protein [Pseudomonadota bacterium]